MPAGPLGLACRAPVVIGLSPPTDPDALRLIRINGLGCAQVDHGVAEDQGYPCCRCVGFVHGCVRALRPVSWSSARGAWHRRAWGVPWIVRPTATSRAVRYCSASRSSRANSDLADHEPREPHPSRCCRRTVHAHAPRWNPSCKQRPAFPSVSRTSCASRLAALAAAAVTVRVRSASARSRENAGCDAALAPQRSPAGSPSRARCSAT